ncbi:MAG: hypothetical protein IPL46_01645 [Saprospiraceae bacterium]|nr:hypothetical protein [Saprospiraceae bacterium]
MTTTAIDSLGNTSEFSDPYQLTTATKAINEDLFNLQVFPNPFTQTIYITYTLEHNEHVRLEIFDGFGKSRLISYEGDQSPGQYTTSWNSRNHAEIIQYNTTKRINRVIKMILVNP